MKKTLLGVLIVLCATSLGCGLFGAPITASDWNCTAFDDYGARFPAWKASRELAVGAAMDECKLQSPSAMTCRVNPEQCIPPKAGG